MTTDSGSDNGSAISEFVGGTASFLMSALIDWNQYLVGPGTRDRARELASSDRSLPDSMGDGGASSTAGRDKVAATDESRLADAVAALHGPY